METEEKVISYSERALIVGLITSDEFISGIAPIYSPRYVENKPTQLIAGWCLDNFKKYGRAPDNHIHDIFEKHRANGLNQDHARLIDNLLYGIAEQYGEESFNPQLILDEAKEAWESKGYELLAEDIKDRLQTGDVAGAKKLQAEFRPFQIEINQDNSLQEALADNSLVMSFEELENTDLPEADKIIKGAIPVEEETITFISGPAGIGKTFLDLELHKVAASGEPGLGGCLTSDGGWKTLYIDGELPERELKRMSSIIGLSNYHGLDVLSKAKIERLGIKPSLDLLSPETREWLSDFILANNYKLVTLDNIFSLFPALDLDSAKEWSPINDWLVRMRSRGVALILLHHLNKANDQIGSIMKLANINTALILHKAIPDDGITEDTACFKITIQKQRGTGLRLAGKKFVFRDGIWSVEGDKSFDNDFKLAQVAVGLVQNKKRSDLATDLGFKNRSSINQKEKDLRDKGFIEGSKEQMVFTDSGRDFVVRYIPEFQGM